MNHKPDKQILIEFLNQHFPKLKLAEPLFHNWPIGLRFEIGPGDMTPLLDYSGIFIQKDEHTVTINPDITDEMIQTNPAYFAAAHQRAVSIFESLFSPHDDLIVVYQLFSYRRQKIRKGDYLYKQIHDWKNKPHYYSKIRNIYRDLYEIDSKSKCFQRICFPELAVKDVNYQNLLLAIIHNDFGNLSPRIRGECYFLHPTKGIILELYDDRGMDVIASDKEVLRELYQKHGDWLLEWERETMDPLFQ